MQLYLPTIPKCRFKGEIDMVEVYEGKKDLPCYEDFGQGPCEFCLDAMECEHATHELKTVKLIEV